jgi:cytochrome c-type biogenesis protein CcmH/NrfF
LLLPRSSGIDSLVWVLPIAALICGAAALGMVFRKWRTADDGAVSAEDNALVDAAMSTTKAMDSNT